jgi:hypothetical protein
MDYPLPSIEQQDQMIEKATTDLKAVMLELFADEEHKPFRLMVKTLLPQLRDSPASSTVRYHGAWAGGLLVHTVSVMQVALTMAETFGPEFLNLAQRNDFRRSIAKATFLHDIGKIGDGDKPYYLPQDNEWRKDKLGERYMINRDLDELTYLPVPIRGTWLAQKFSVYLSPEEVQAVVASDGPQTEMGRVVSTFLETPLTMLVHFADKWVSQVRRV